VSHRTRSKTLPSLNSIFLNPKPIFTSIEKSHWKLPQPPNLRSWIWGASAVTKNFQKCTYEGWMDGEWTHTFPLTFSSQTNHGGHLSCCVYYLPSNNPITITCGYIYIYICIYLSRLNLLSDVMPCWNSVVLLQGVFT